MQTSKRIPKWNIWMLAGSVGLTALLCFLCFGVFWLAVPNNPTETESAAFIFTVIPAPTLTATPEGYLTPTPTQALVSADGIAVGAYVQIFGTEGQGLRLRSGPSTDFPPLFLGLEAEVFKVEDGPKLGNTYTWWYLVAPYDKTRSGWAASTYLSLVEAPTDVP